MISAIFRSKNHSACLFRAKTQAIAPPSSDVVVGLVASHKSLPRGQLSCLRYGAIHHSLVQQRPAVSCIVALLRHLPRTPLTVLFVLESDRTHDSLSRTKAPLRCLFVGFPDKSCYRGPLSAYLALSRSLRTDHASGTICSACCTCLGNSSLSWLCAGHSEVEEATSSAILVSVVDCWLLSFSPPLRACYRTPVSSTLAFYASLWSLL